MCAAARATTAKPVQAKLCTTSKTPRSERSDTVDDTSERTVSQANVGKAMRKELRRTSGRPECAKQTTGRRSPAQSLPSTNNNNPAWQNIRAGSTDPKLENCKAKTGVPNQEKLLGNRMAPV